MQLSHGKVIRRLLIASILVASMSAVATKTVYAYYCDPFEISDYDYSWVNRCAPGGEDACGWFRDWCWINCFAAHIGNFCDAFGDACQESNYGTESAPNWCITGGVCRCTYV
jgi:hypothetical protein